MANAEHILSWAENSGPHYQCLNGLSKYPRDASFSLEAARMAFVLACETYRDMRRRGDIREPYLSADILEAAFLMLAWESPEKEEQGK